MFHLYFLFWYEHRIIIWIGWRNSGTPKRRIFVFKIRKRLIFVYCTHHLKAVWKDNRLCNIDFESIDMRFILLIALACIKSNSKSSLSICRHIYASNVYYYKFSVNFYGTCTRMRNELSAFIYAFNSNSKHTSRAFRLT